MTDAPERIWAEGNPSGEQAQHNRRGYRWWHDAGDLQKSDLPHCTEYIRADIHEAEVLRLREQAAFRDEADALMAHSRNAELNALRAEVERLRGRIDELEAMRDVNGFITIERVSADAVLRAKLEGE
jgi:hypothetical protein